MNVVIEKIGRIKRKEITFAVLLLLFTLFLMGIDFDGNMRIRFIFGFKGRQIAFYALTYGMYLLYITVFHKQLYTAGRVYSCRKALLSIVALLIFPYLLGYLMYYTGFFTMLILWLQKNKLQFDILLKLLLLGPVLIVSIFQVKLPKKHWTFSGKQLAVVLCMLITYVGVFLMFGNSIALTDRQLLASKSGTALRMIFYPGLYEELLYRGLLMGILIGFGLKERKANMVQAIAFALCHWPQFRNAGIFMFLGVSSFILPGYIFGRLYLKTKSIALCALFHGLHNAVVLFFGF